MADKFTITAGTTLPEIAEEVATELAFITRSISPLLAEIGYPNDIEVVGNPKHSWGEDALLGNSATVNGALSNSATAITVDTPLGLNFVIGDEVQIEGSIELMIVVAATPTATVINVTRGIKGTSGVIIPDNSVLKRVGHPVIENATASTARPTSRTRPTNYTQLFEGTASVTHSMQNSTLLFSIPDELEHQIDAIMKDRTRDIAMSVIRGKVQSSNPEGTTSQSRTMNGIIQSILAGSDPSTIDALGVGLDESLINRLMQDMATKGGTPKLLAAGPAQRRRLSALLQGRQRFPVENNLLGGVVERFQSDFGVIDVLADDIFIPNNLVMILDPAKINLVKLGSDGDPFVTKPLALVGLAIRQQIVAEIGLVIKNAGTGGHGLITGLATT